MLCEYRTTNVNKKHNRKVSDNKLNVCTDVDNTYIDILFRCIPWAYKLQHLFVMPHLGYSVFWSVHPFVRPFVRSSVRSSVCPFVRSLFRPSVPLQVKVFGRGSFWWSWSPIYLKLSTHVSYNMIFLILMPN